MGSRQGLNEKCSRIFLRKHVTRNDVKKKRLVFGFNVHLFLYFADSPLTLITSHLNLTEKCVLAPVNADAINSTGCIHRPSDVGGLTSANHFCCTHACVKSYYDNSFIVESEVFLFHDVTF